MTFYRSIRFRLVAGILMFGAVLILLYAGMTFFIMKPNMTRLISNLVRTEVDAFVDNYRRDPATSLPYSRYVKMFKGIDAVPEHLKHKIRDLPPGVHILDHGKGPPLHVGVIQLPDTDVPCFLIFHSKEFFDANAFLHPRQILVLTLAIMLIPGLLIGILFSRMIYAPMAALMNRIKTLNPEDIPARFSETHSDDEIGLLTRTIETTLNRIKDFIQREKQFTRDASHELRTPLTVIKGAVEIMEQQPEPEQNPLLKRPLERISRSVRDMETTIETFLWLAREGHGTEGRCRVARVVEKAARDNQHLIDNKPVLLSIHVHFDPEIEVREEILYIAVTNLIRNAFYFTRQGTVSVIIDETGIDISDTGPGIQKDQLDQVTQASFKSEKSSGFGFGLSIVSRLCRQFGWRLEFESRPENGTRVRILW